MKYKNIIGGTQADAEKKFPWLAKADLKNAEIDITGRWLVWEGGTWKGGTWKGGIWEGGTWEGGTWEGGFWEDGIWEDGFWEYGIWEYGIWKSGFMWSNLDQGYIKVKHENGKFVKI